MCLYVSRLCAQYCGGDVTVCRWMHVCMYAHMYVCNIHVNIVMCVYMCRVSAPSNGVVPVPPSPRMDFITASGCCCGEYI